MLAVLLFLKKANCRFILDSAYGETCVENIQCQITLTINSVCDFTTKTCMCADNAHLFTDGKCYMSNREYMNN